MNAAIVQGVLQGAVVTLATAGVTLFATYASTHSWSAALVAGGAAACAWVVSHYTTAGVQSKWLEAQPPKV